LPILTYPPAFGTRLARPHFSFAKTFGNRKLESLGYCAWCYLHDPTFSRFSRTVTCDRETDRHMTMAYTALAWVVHGPKAVLLYFFYYHDYYYCCCCCCCCSAAAAAAATATATATATTTTTTTTTTATLLLYYPL